MYIIAGKNDIAVCGLAEFVKRFPLEKILFLPNKNESGIDGYQRSAKKYANEIGVRIATLEEVEELNEVDIFLSLEFDRLINPKKISTSKIFNIHFSYLPSYKGMYTSYFPILMGDSHSGVTLHEIDEGIDTGRIIAQKRIEIANTDRGQDLYRAYTKTAAVLLSENLDSLISGNYSSASQNTEGSTYYGRGSVDFGQTEILFTRTAWEVQCFVRAMCFRQYQLPTYAGKPVVGVNILERRSEMRPGYEICLRPESVTVSTIDYDVEVYFDGLSELLDNIHLQSADTLEYSLKRVSGVNDQDNRGWTLLICACFAGRIDLVEKLIYLGADVNLVNFKGTTPLMYAKDNWLKTKDPALIHLLLANGADPNLTDFAGKNVLDYLEGEDRDELYRVLGPSPRR